MRSDPSIMYSAAGNMRPAQRRQRTYIRLGGQVAACATSVVNDIGL